MRRITRHILDLFSKHVLVHIQVTGGMGNRHALTCH